MKWGIWLIIGLFLTANAAAAMNLVNSSCDDGIVFILDYPGSDFDARDFTVYARHIDSKEPFVVTGIWTDRSATTPIISIWGYLFESVTPFVKPGKYYINITRNESKRNKLPIETKEVESLGFEIICKDTAFKCGLVNLNIDKCYTVNKRTFVYFSGLGGEQYNALNLPADMTYKLIGNTIYDNVPPENVEFKALGNDKYLMTYPNNGSTSWVWMQLARCNSTRFNLTGKTSKCSDASLCRDDNECSDYEFCNNMGFCEGLVCSNCEKTSQHKCISRCDDNNPCTNDICENGNCRYVKNNNCCYYDSDCDDNSKCTLDKCNNGVCVHESACSIVTGCTKASCTEEKGCLYYQDIACVQKELVKSEFEKSILGIIIKWIKSLF